MSVKMMSAVFDKSLTHGNTRLVLLALSDGASDDGIYWPKLSNLAKKVNLSEQVTKEHIAALARVGVITKTARHDSSGRQTSNQYQIVVEKIGQDDVTREILDNVRPASRIRGGANTGEGVGVGLTRVRGGGANTGEGDGGLTRVRGSYIEPSEEPSEDPSRATPFALISEPLKNGAKRKSGDLFPDLLPMEYLNSFAFAESWKGFVEHRIAIKAPLTDRAVRLLMAKIKPWGIAKACEALDNSTASGKWTNVYDPSESRNGNSYPSNQRRNGKPGAASDGEHIMG